MGHIAQLTLNPSPKTKMFVVTNSSRDLDIYLLPHC